MAPCVMYARDYITRSTHVGDMHAPERLCLHKKLLLTRLSLGVGVRIRCVKGM